MLQLKLRGLFIEPFTEEGVPKTGGRLTFVLKVYHFLVYRPLPVGSVALTQTLYVVKYTSPESESDLVPFDAPVPLVVCPRDTPAKTQRVIG